MLAFIGHGMGRARHHADGAGGDGRSRIDVPDVDTGTEYEVVLTAKTPPPEELGWPKGNFEAIGNLDDSFMRHPQGVPESMGPLDP